MKWIPSNQHSVEHHSQSPHVRGSARVLGVGPEDLGGHVGWAAVLVGEEVVTVLLQDNGVLQRLQLHLSP